MSVSSGQSTNLINLQDEKEPEQPCLKSIQNSTKLAVESKTTVKKSYSRLCGYLNKLGNRGILKTYKRRWFVFSEDNCKLYYYKSSQDLVPLGEIDISQATFSYDITNKEKRGTFRISVPGKHYYLDAGNRRTCIFWLQELQKFRRTNSLIRTELIQGCLNVSGTQKVLSSGLLANSNPNAKLIESNVEDNLLMDLVDYPVNIGDSSIPEASSRPLSIAQQKFHNLKNQVWNSVNAIRQDRSVSSEGLNTQESDVQSKRSSGYSVQNSTFFDDVSSETSSLNEVVSPPSPSKKGLSGFRSRISESFRKQRYSDDEEPSSSSRKGSKKYYCASCHENRKEIQSLQDEVSTLQTEVSASRSVIKTLQKQLDIVLKEKETIIQLREINNSNGTLEMLYKKDEEIVNLQLDIQEQKQEVERLQNEITQQKDCVQEKTDLYQELLQQKDSQIISLTNEIFDLETEKKDQEFQFKPSGSVSALEAPKVSGEIFKDLDDEELLKDAVQAYELQNKFLNKEVLELNELRSDAEQREHVLKMQCSDWEARCCQIQSKLLYLLKELEKPDSNGNGREIISRLLQEAVTDGDSPDVAPSWSFEQIYDDLGFNYKWGKDDLVSLKAANLKQRSDDLANKAKQDAEAASLRIRWENFMVTVANKELQLTPELKILLRQGIPKEHKGKIWKGCIEMRIKFMKMKLGSDYYDKLLNSQEYVSTFDPASKQIELDLLRTLPNNQHYESLDADGIPKLRRVLLAYSRHDPIVGYCQGLNRLAAISLLFMEEEDAFWCLVAIIKYLMPDGYYNRTLTAAQVDQRVLKDLMADKLPKLHTHLEQYNVDLSLFSFNWFLTIFIDNIPIETTLRIWDVFLFEGSKVLFRYALAFFKYCENDIVILKDYIVINKYLRTIAENMTDVKRLQQIAFGELNPFPQRVITAKRAQHMQIVKAELEELEKLRYSLPRNIEKCPSAECLSEED